MGRHPKKMALLSMLVDLILSMTRAIYGTEPTT